MSKQEKKVNEQETGEAQEAGKAAEAVETEESAAPEETGETVETAEEETGEPETFTVTKEQMEAMEALAGQLAALKDQHLRLAAEYDNYRKRTAKEKEGLYRDARNDTIVKFLEVYDNLERAVQQAGDEENVHKKGMEMIFHQLMDILTKLGVEILDPLGQPFDPERHNAVMHIEDEEKGESIVTAVFQKGFLLGDKVLRFAAVQVAN